MRAEGFQREEKKKMGWKFLGTADHFLCVCVCRFQWKINENPLFKKDFGRLAAAATLPFICGRRGATQQ